MPKNLVVCCDGTANEFAQDRTNVLKLFSALAQNPEKQFVLYHPGVGTMEAVSALTSTARKATSSSARRSATGWKPTSGTPTPPS